MELSVVIPVFNTDISLFQRCLNSVCHLSISDYEVLIVDDGSKENIQEFCIAFIKNKTNFKYLKKTNGGVSSARNYGLKQAKGKYVTFLDSDDELISDIKLDMSTYQNADLVFFDRTLIKENLSSIRKELPRSEGFVLLSDIYKEIIVNNRFHGPVGRLYKLDLIRKNNIFFDQEMIQGEDVVFNIKYLSFCNKIYYDTRSIYKYYLSPITLVNRWKKDSILMLTNLHTVYNNKKVIIGTFSVNNKNDLVDALTSNTLYSLFQSAMDMVTAKVFSCKQKEACYYFCRELLENKTKLSMKSTTAAFIIKNRLWLLIYFICPIRRIFVNNFRKKWK